MELIVCMFLASLITGVRPVSDMVHALKGQEPPHLTKARLKAETQKAKLAAQQAKAENRAPRPGEDKPTLRDVFRVYRGDALADVIDAHEQRRKAKKARQSGASVPAEKGPSLLRRAWNLIARPVGESAPADPVVPGQGQTTVGENKVVEQVESALTAADGDTKPPNGLWIKCDECDARLADVDGGYQHPAGSNCPKAAAWTRRAAGRTETGQEPLARKAQEAVRAEHNRRATSDPDLDAIRSLQAMLDESRRRRPMPRAACPRCHAVKELIASGWCEGCTVKHMFGWCPDCHGAMRLDGDVWRHGDHWPCQTTTPVAGNVHPCVKCRTPIAAHPSVVKTLEPVCGRCGTANPRRQKPRTAPQPTEAPTRPADSRQASTEGETMPDPSPSTSSGSATGDAHNVETALNECNLLDDDLTRIDTALDVIDEAITSAAGAAEKIEAFLQSKNVDDCAVGGMASARDQLSADRIKTLIDAIGAAKQGVKGAEEELRRLQDLESQLNGADGSILNGR